MKDQKLKIELFQIIISRHNSSDHNDNTQIASLI
jgi:hypothetical protein